MMVRYVLRRNVGPRFHELGVGTSRRGTRTTRMHPSAQVPSRPKRRMPNWLKIILAVFAVLFILGAIFGKSPDQSTTAAPSTSPPTTSSAATPAAEAYTVATVTDSATLEVVDSDGVRKTVHVMGVTTVGTSSDCFGAESLAWATSKLTGTVVHLGTETAGAVTVALADGRDYAALAVQNGYLKSATSAFEAAETAARQGARGFWGPPCNGSVNVAVPATQPAPQPTSTPPAPSTKAAPQQNPVRTTAEEPPAPEPDNGSVYYANCAEARAAGVAPIHKGEPGYRKGLDRDGDGVACDKG
ncbi:thermonuclease family protein [Amycolatopsis vastitatis]|uniref:Excalibur calcium-binding domain-containing protein n=1 Tax=Amycolatopsis vastitatis TaxID=1905142 RepID=A0A229TIY3_9PSEU|nr:excalibur calcium-binding domain-containing protein [Amycolatopsis vastitatis]OXM71192.1 hypothetical protein CF165_01750 [Amycolatopsis vastitatis]